MLTICRNHWVTLVVPRRSTLKPERRMPVDSWRFKGAVAPTEETDSNGVFRAANTTGERFGKIPQKAATGGRALCSARANY